MPATGMSDTELQPVAMTGRIVHVRRVDVGGENETPRRTTYEVFYPAGKGRKHAEEMRAAVESFIRSAVSGKRISVEREEVELLARLVLEPCTPDDRMRARAIVAGWLPQREAAE